MSLRCFPVLLAAQELSGIELQARLGRGDAKSAPACRAMGKFSTTQIHGGNNMSDINDFAMYRSEHTLDEMLRKEAERVLREMDFFSATRHNERTGVSACYARQYVLCHRVPQHKYRSVGLSDIVGLDSSVVAQDLFPDLEADGKDRVSHMIDDLVAHARTYLVEMQEAVPKEEDTRPSSQESCDGCVEAHSGAV